MLPIARTADPLRRLWWLEPATLFAGVSGGTMLAAAWQSEDAYLLYGTPKFISAWHVLLAATAIAAFALGVRLGGATGRQPRSTPSAAQRIVKVWFWAAFGLTLFGYAVWLAVGVKNGFTLGMLREFLTTDDPLVGERIRTDLFVSLPGITTCTQFGVGAVVLGLWLYFAGYRRAIWAVMSLLVLAAARALVFSERLAVIELAVPAAILAMRARVLGRVWSPAIRRGLQLAPLAGVVGIVVLFGSFEYFRSWRYYQHQFDSYAEFTLWRVTGYYTTAHNNSAMALETQPRYPLPYATLRSFWSLPGLDETPLGYQRLTGVDPEARHEAMLERFGTPELNNEGGLFQPALDYGLAGLLLFWFGAGFVSGRLYRSYLVGTLAGLTMYPILVIAILETPRFLYLSYTRSLPAIALLVVVVWLAAGASEETQSHYVAEPAPV